MVRSKVHTWQPTVQQREAARLLAASMTWQMTANRVGVKSLQTIATWLNDPNFARLKAAYEKQFDEYLETEITGALSEMMALWRQFVRGEVPPNDKRIGRIAPSCIKYIENYVGIEDRPAEGSPAVYIDNRRQSLSLPANPMVGDGTQ